MKRITFQIFTIILLLTFTFNAQAKKTSKEKTQPEKLNPETIKNEVINPAINNDIQEVANIKWSESLRFRDFHHLPYYLEIKDKLKTYTEHIAKVYQEHPHVFSSTVEYGILLLDTGKLEEAKKVWDLALKDFPANETPKLYRAWVDALNGDYITAKNGWYTVINEKIMGGVLNSGSALLWLPQHIDAVTGLYLIKDHLTGNDKIEAEKIVDEVINTFPKQSRFAAILISKDLQEGKLKAAAVKLSKSLEASPEDSVLITLLGITQLLSNYNDEALKLFNAATEIDSSLPTIQIMKARALFAQNKKKEAFQTFDLALKLDPSIQLDKEQKKTFLTLPAFSVSLETSKKGTNN